MKLNSCLKTSEPEEHNQKIQTTMTNPEFSVTVISLLNKNTQI
jgi:hypothetical protein